jgi:hypothetical protein
MPQDGNAADDAGSQTKKDNRPTWSEGEIPDILEWKLDVIMAQLARMGGGAPSEHNPPVGSGTVTRLRDPREFDPLTDPFPEWPGIPKILEWKLDVIMAQLARGNAPALFIIFVPIIVILIFGLGGILAALLAIIMLLNAILGVLTAMQALLAALLILALFVVVQIAVPYIIKRNKKKLEEYLHPSPTPNP